MFAEPPIAKVAHLIGEPARALMLTALMDGRSWTAGELARASGVTPQTASTHLSKLADAQLIAIEQRGRHRYHRLASADVGRALEALMAVTPAAVRQRLAPRDPALRHARSCYDHMAGEVAVHLADRFVQLEWISVGAAWSLTSRGRRALATWGLEGLEDEDVGGMSRRPLLRPCLDWSERRDHLGGQLGARLLDAFLANDWARRRPDSRALVITPSGRQAIQAL